LTRDFDLSEEFKITFNVIKTIVEDSIFDY